MTYGACGRSRPLTPADAAVEAAPDAARDAGTDREPDASPETGGNPFGLPDAAEAPDRQFVGNLIP
jgi:hypothetical protein